MRDICFCFLANHWNTVGMIECLTFFFFSYYFTNKFNLNILVKAGGVFLLLLLLLSIKTGKNNIWIWKKTQKQQKPTQTYTNFNTYGVKRRRQLWMSFVFISLWGICCFLLLLLMCFFSPIKSSFFQK